MYQNGKARFRKNLLWGMMSVLAGAVLLPQDMTAEPSMVVQPEKVGHTMGSFYNREIRI